MDKMNNALNSVKNALLGTNFAMIAFVAYVSKIIYLGASLEDSLILLSISVLYGYNMHLKSKKPDPIQLNSEVQTQIIEIQRQIRDTQMEKNIKHTPKRYF